MSEQAASAATMAATGAKIGSVIPGIGTVIGAVVGAIVGWLGAKKKPVRPTAQQLADCKTLLSEYAGYAAQMPSQPIPLTKQQLLDIHWCLQAHYGGKYIGVKDPRWFNPGVEQALFPAALQLVKKIYETPIGQQVKIDAITFKDPKGKSLSFQGFNFVNPQFTDLKTFTDQYWMPMAIQYCENTAGKGAPGCNEYYRTPEFKRWLYDVISWAARESLPNISEADLKAASAVAATMPNTAASTVVAAVEQIIGRTVTSGETATLLTPATTPPVPGPAPPSSQPVTTLPAPGQTTPSNTGTSDIAALVSSLLAQGASQTEAFNDAISSLQSKGVVVTPQDKQTIATEIDNASAWYKQPVVMIGGAALIGLLAFGMLSPKRRRA